MSSYPAHPPDFRDAAVAASEAALDELARRDPSLRQDPLRAGVSLCLRAPGGGEAVRRRLKWDVVLRLVLGFAGLLGGALLAGYAERSSKVAPSAVPRGPWLAVGVGCSVVGMVSLLGAVGATRRRVRRHVRGRLTLHQAGDAVVEVEPTETFSKMKAVSEDLGLLLLYPDRRCLVVEGLTHRYLVHARDVVAVREVPGSTTVGAGILYSAGGQPLDITLGHQSLWVELKRQTIGSGRDRVLEKIVKTLAPDGPPLPLGNALGTLYARGGGQS